MFEGLRVEGFTTQRIERRVFGIFPPRARHGLSSERVGVSGLIFDAQPSIHCRKLQRLVRRENFEKVGVNDGNFRLKLSYCL